MKTLYSMVLSETFAPTEGMSRVRQTTDVVEFVGSIIECDAQMIPAMKARFDVELAAVELPNVGRVDGFWAGMLMDGGESTRFLYVTRVRQLARIG